MPDWAKHNALEFWKAADQFERKNGSTYREHEIALPRELNTDQRQALVTDWIAQEIGDKYPYQYAIHVPKAADGKDQPHVHLMFSERIMDGIERDPNQHFKRYNSKNPERGGAKKDNTGLKHSERKEKLIEQRKRWENLCNQHLERAGHHERIDMRSYKEQGKDQQPEPKHLPSEWRKHKAQIIELREANKAKQQAQQESQQLIKNPEATLIDLQQQKQQRLKKQTQQKAAVIRKQFEEERLERKRQQQREKEQEEKSRQPQWMTNPESTKAEYIKQQTLLKTAITTKAHQLYQRILSQYHQANQEANYLYHHRPEKPTGLFAAFKQKAYEKAYTEHEEKRLNRLDRATTLSKRLRIVEGYTDTNDLERYPPNTPTPANHRIDREMEKHYPELKEKGQAAMRTLFIKNNEALMKRQKERQRSRGRYRGGFER